jgi:hypothetical protein
VVVGARLSAAEPDLRTCQSGVCRAQDLAAWTEVQSAGGDWVAVDVTPQYAESPSLEVTEQRDPENVTEVRPDSVEEVVPPDPVQEDSASDDAIDDQAGPDLAWLGPFLRITGLVLFVLALAFGPLLVVVGAKAARRRSRRTTGSPAARIAGGWDEYVDAAVDAGRLELAAALATPRGPDLAHAADRAVFSGDAAPDEDVVAFWRLVDAERRSLLGERGFWRRVAATVSLKSFFRQLAPSSGVRKRLAERGKRRVAEPVRLTP